MPNAHLPPTEKTQDWVSIWLVIVVIFISVFVGTLWLSWDWFTGWGTLREHWPLTKPKNLMVFKMWLNEWLYYWQYIKDNNFELPFFAHTAPPAIFSAVITWFTTWFVFLSGSTDRVKHISGLYLYEYRKAINHAKKQLKRECKTNSVVQGIKLHPELALPKNRESQNFLFVGGAGGGKTMLINPLIQQIICFFKKLFIFDAKKEYTKWFFIRNRVLLIAPWDSRSRQWDIAADAKTPLLAQLIAENMIPESSNDPLWSNGARMIFTGMMVILNNQHEEWGWKELANILSLPETELIPLLNEYYPRASRFVAENSKTTQSFFATLIGSLGFIYTLAQFWPKSYKGGISIIKWVKSQNTCYLTLIVQADNRYKDIGTPVCSAMIGLMTATILSMDNSHNRELWLVLDELGNLPASSYLKEWLSLGRSMGCRCIAGTQSISQIKEIYGENGTDTLLALFGFFVALRSSSAGRAVGYCAEIFGKRLVESPSYSLDENGHTQTTWHAESIPLVTESNICHELPQPSKNGVHGFLLFPGWGVYKLCWPLSILPQIAPEHIPIKLLTNSAKEKTTKPEKSTRRERRR